MKKILNIVRQYMVISTMACLATLNSCQQVIEIRDDSEPLLVVNGLLEAGSDSTLITVSLTRPAASSSPWRYVENAEVSLYKDDNVFLSTAHAVGTGQYLFRDTIEAGTNYKVVVASKTHGTAWGETRVPSSLEETGISLSDEFVDVQWRDNAQEKNYYWIGALRPYDYHSPKGSYCIDTLVPIPVLYSTTPLADPFNRVMDGGDWEINTTYDYYIRIDDDGLAGELLEVEIWVRRKPNLKVFLLSADPHLDRYLKSSVINYTFHEAVIDFPLFYEPAYTYSNITGGVGLIGSYTSGEGNYLKEKYEDT